MPGAVRAPGTSPSPGGVGTGGTGLWAGHPGRVIAHGSARLYRSDSKGWWRGGTTGGLDSGQVCNQPAPSWQSGAARLTVRAVCVADSRRVRREGLKGKRCDSPHPSLGKVGRESSMMFMTFIWLHGRWEIHSTCAPSAPWLSNLVMKLSLHLSFLESPGEALAALIDLGVEGP